RDRDRTRELCLQLDDLRALDLAHHLLGFVEALGHRLAVAMIEPALFDLDHRWGLVAQARLFLQLLYMGRGLLFAGVDGDEVGSAAVGRGLPDDPARLHAGLGLELLCLALSQQLQEVFHVRASWPRRS